MNTRREYRFKLISNRKPHSPVSDAYRVIRTNIQFLKRKKDIKSILVTSTRAGEGKSLTCINLAIAMAQTNMKTLYVDADLRRPGVHRAFVLSNETGLTSYLMGECDLETVVHEEVMANLSVVPAGPVPMNPVELLESPAMTQFLEKMADRYEIILVDSAPMIVPDASILAMLTDGCIFVVEAQKTKRASAQRAIQQLKKLHVNILGVVLNKQKEKYLSEDYYYSY